MVVEQIQLHVHTQAVDNVTANQPETREADRFILHRSKKGARAVFVCGTPKIVILLVVFL